MMDVDRWLLWGGAFGIFARVLLAAAGANEVLRRRVEVVTPLTSYMRLAEGRWLMQQGFSPYQGSMYHGSPVLLSFIGPFLPSPEEAVTAESAVLLSFPSILADGLSAILLHTIARYRRRQRPLPQGKEVSSDLLKRLGDAAGVLYLLNPYAVLACLGGSTAPVENFTALIALVGAVTGNPALAAFGLVMATHLTLHPVFLLFPIFLLLSNGLDCRPGSASMDPKRLRRVARNLFVWIILWATALLALCWVLLRDNGGLAPMLRGTFGFLLEVEDLTPNIGLFWYFFTEMFEHFRTFYLFVFHTVMLPLLALPLALRLPNRPLFLAYLLLGLSAIFKPYPSVADVALYLSLLPLFLEELQRMRFLFLIGNAFLYVSVLGPILYNMWVWKNTGNSNFFYAITLAFSCTQAVLLVESALTMLRYNYDSAKVGGMPKQASSHSMQS